MDVDIDLKTDFNPSLLFPSSICASRVFDDKLLKHPAGVYFQKIPVDPQTNLAAIPFNEAEQLGYFKIDLLHLSLLDSFDSKEQITTLLKTDPDWDLLQSPLVVSKLFQIHQHYDTIIQIQPRSIDDIADCIALIRPAKKRLLPKYIEAMNDDTKKQKLRNILYAPPINGGAWFKKPHSIAYAMTIALQLHLIKAGIV